MSNTSEDCAAPKTLEDLEARLGYQFTDRALLSRALTHRSFANEDLSRPEHNERLEFLGDAALQLSITTALLEQFPTVGEGALSLLRASLVNEHHLAQLADRLGIGYLIRLGRGMRQDQPKVTSSSLLSNALEAILGAVYLDDGFETVDQVIREMFADAFTTVLVSQDVLTRDYKTPLQELCMKQFGELPRYETVGTEGPPHDCMFRVVVFVCGRELARAVGRRRKEAEQNAAKVALSELKTAQAPPAGDSESAQAPPAGDSE